jgi:acyl transferase domain-containing protein
LTHLLKGTAKGDPSETAAVGKNIGSVKSATDKFIIGSVKANVGHLEGVSGLGGLVKVVYGMETGLIPPQINFIKANPKILWDKYNLMVPLKGMS